MVTEGVVWKLEKDLCRCCHAEGTFANLATPQSFMDQREIYSDMLRDCLDIDITPVPGGLCNITYTICPNCVAKLREANTFKQQVIQCEEKFSEMLYKNSILGPSCVKSEPEVDLDDFKAIFSPDDSDDDIDKPLYEFQLDEEVESEEDEPKHQITLRKRPTKEEEKHTPDAGSVNMKKTTKPKAKAKAPAKKTSQKTSQKTEETVPSKKQKEGTTNMRMFYFSSEDYIIKDDCYICIRCKKLFKNYDSMRSHIRIKHLKIPLYTCPSCNQGFMSRAKFTLHKLEKHNLDDRYHCSACAAKYNTPRELGTHIKVFHMLGEKRKCPSCDFETLSARALYTHKLKHKTVKDHHCKFCKKAFLRKGSLKLHERIHTGDKRNVCKVCGKAFVQKTSLNYHMTKYHPNVQF